MKAFFKKIYIEIMKLVVSTRAEISIKSAIRVMRGIYFDERERRDNERENKHYLAVIKMPVVRQKKGKYFLMSREKLYWVNRRNFREVKRRGWLPVNMKLNELRAKAFYYTSAERTYPQEQEARQKAIHKYRAYLLSKI